MPLSQMKGQAGGADASRLLVAPAAFAFAAQSVAKGAGVPLASPALSRRRRTARYMYGDHTNKKTSPLPSKITCIKVDPRRCIRNGFANGELVPCNLDTCQSCPGYTINAIKWRVHLVGHRNITYEKARAVHELDSFSTLPNLRQKSVRAWCMNTSQSDQCDRCTENDQIV